jgi:hypothetical protein
VNGGSIIGADMCHRAAATLLLLISSALPSSVVDAGQTPRGVLGTPFEAIFEQGELKLAESWGDATACIELGDHTECFRTEQQLLAVHPDYGATGGATKSGEMKVGAAIGAATPSATCSSPLRLYRLTGFKGGTLVLTTRGVVLNLSTYGFDSDTSSYVVGSCASTFWSGASGSGSVYPGPTGACTSASSMSSGWNNVVSSVYIS